MSTRPIIYPIKDIRPIRRALGSNDETLVDRILAIEFYQHYKRLGRKGGYPESDSITRLTKLARQFIAGEFADRDEPGQWRTVVDNLARVLGVMSVTALPIFGGWKRWGWDDYAVTVQGALAERSNDLIRHLVRGRSLSGRRLDSSSCELYAWLTRSEVRQLAGGLRPLPGRVERLAGDDWLVEFHQQLVASLDRCRGQCLLLLG